MSLIKKVAKTAYKKTIGAGNPSIAKVAKTAYKSSPVYGLVKVTKTLNKTSTPRRRK